MSDCNSSKGSKMAESTKQASVAITINNIGGSAFVNILSDALTCRSNAVAE
jgi:hypothetical protein